MRIDYWDYQQSILMNTILNCQLHLNAKRHWCRLYAYYHSASGVTVTEYRVGNRGNRFTFEVLNSGISGNQSTTWIKRAPLLRLKYDKKKGNLKEFMKNKRKKPRETIISAAIICAYLENYNLFYFGRSQHVNLFCFALALMFRLEFRCFVEKKG